MRKVTIGSTITVHAPERAYSSSAPQYQDRVLLPGSPARVFAVPPCVYGMKCRKCEKRHQTFYAVEFTHPDGMKDRAGVMPCNVAEVTNA